MRYTCAVVVLLGVAVTGAWAQEGVLSPRALGMGSAAIAVADDAAAWFQNPAGLAELNVPAAEGKTWGNAVMGGYMHFKSTPTGSAPGVTSNGWGATWSGFDPAKGFGAGAGFADASDQGRVFGVGVGTRLPILPLAVGANWVRAEAANGDSINLINLGAMHLVPQVDKAPVRFGLVVADVTNRTDNGPMWDLGAYWPATPQLGIAVDVLDVTGKTSDGPFFNAGAEYKLGETGEWAVRAGLLDTGSESDVTVGAGYTVKNWRFDAAWADVQDGMFEITAETHF